MQLIFKEELLDFINKINNVKVKEILLKAVKCKNIDYVIMNKLINMDYSKINDTLINIASDSVFKVCPELFDIIITQTNEYSQMELFNALNSKLITDKCCIRDMLYYTDQPIIQKRIRLYAEIKTISDNELIYSSMLNIDSEKVEQKLREYFVDNKIKNEKDYIKYLKKERKKNCF